GASPRGSQSLLLLGRALAALGGRDYVLPDDIKRVAVPVLAHRLTLTPQAWAQGVLSSDIVRAVVSQVAVRPTVGAARCPRRGRPGRRDSAPPRSSAPESASSSPGSDSSPPAPTS